MRIICLSLGLLVGFVVPALAQGTADRPAACQQLLTVQLSTCEVDQHFVCPKGETFTRRVESYEAHGLDSIEVIDERFVPVEFHGVGLEANDVELVVGTGSRTHPREVILSGSGEGAFSADLVMFGLSREIVITEKYRSKGDVEVHAGIAFNRIDSEAGVTLPAPMKPAVGTVTYLYDPILDVLVESKVLMMSGGAVFADVEMKELFARGQPGFEDTVPKYGCGELSALPQTLPEGKT